MDLNVYRCADGCLLLVPDCFAPSIRARHRYGPLRLVGTVSLDETPRWRDTFDGIDERSFAVIEDAGAIGDVLSSATFRLMLDDSPPAAAV
jgi:hypothetical protein